jgi:hypothetical protein
MIELSYRFRLSEKEAGHLFAPDIGKPIIGLIFYVNCIFFLWQADEGDGITDELIIYLCTFYFKQR